MAKTEILTPLPMNKANYPDNWKEIAELVKDVADWQCHGYGVAHGAIIATLDPYKESRYKGVYMPTTEILTPLTLEDRYKEICDLIINTHLKYDIIIAWGALANPSYYEPRNPVSKEVVLPEMIRILTDIQRDIASTLEKISK